MGNRFWEWILMSAVTALLLFVASWLWTSREVQAKEPQQVASQQEEASDQARREYVLEVIGMGVTVDRYRQGTLWEALQKGSPYVTIREQDPKKYPWSAMDKDGYGGGRAMDALENGARRSPMYWGVPSFYAGPPNLKNSPHPDRPVSGLVGGADTTGMAWHLFVTGPWKLAERPDRLLEDVFAFFDTHPDVPYIVLTSEDSLGTRESCSPPKSPSLLKNGYYVTERPDSSAVFVLARRERVDPLRAAVWDDPQNDFLQAKVINLYYQLGHAVPHPERKKVERTPAQVGADPSDADPKGPFRHPSVAEWLEAAAAFSHRADLHGGFMSSSPHPPRSWKPTPWFPIPWNRDQLATFDRLPTLGYLHRPVFVKFQDEHGKPLARRDARENALFAGWRQALLTLPEVERQAAPSRLIVATADNADQLMLLHALMNRQSGEGGPEIDTGNSSQFIDTDRRLGNTGATTWFVQMAIGIMGSYREGGVSAAINLRDPDEASIVLISPPSEEKRRTQQHPKGGDVLRHALSPEIDLIDYRNSQR